MKKILSCLVSIALALSAFASSVSSQQGMLTNRLSHDVFGFAPKAKAEARAITAHSPALKRATGISSAQAAMQDYATTILPFADAQGFLDAPNGETWYYSINYDSEVVEHGAWKETLIKGYEITVYDATMKLVGTIKDEVILTENETKVAQVQVGTLLTKKFFNIDNDYELMVCVACNTAEYVNQYHTYVYTIGNNTPITTIDGYYVSAVNTAVDEWSEKFWITFITEEETATPDINGVINFVDYVFRTYKSAGYSGMGDPVLTTRVPAITIPGENAIPFSSTAYQGLPYFATNHMKYCWFEDPYDMTNENPTPDNALICNIYTMPSAWANTAELYSTTTVASGATLEDCYFLYNGSFSGNDVSFGRYTDDGTPSLIITCEHFIPSKDDYTYDYYVVSAAPKGTTAEGVKLLDLAKGVSGGYFMSDIPGQAPQVMFIKAETSSSYLFTFVNLLNGKEEFFLPSTIEGNLSVTTQTDRVVTADGYLLVCPQTHGESDREGNVFTSVVYLNIDGTIHHVDRLNLGKDIDLAQVYSGENAFNPYIFNVDDAREYLVLVKRRNVSGQAGNHEELLLVSSDPDKDYLLQLTPDEELGVLNYIALTNVDNDYSNLSVIYGAEDGKMVNVNYALPLSLYEEGDGTPENPYVITTVGGLQQIKANPNAHYVIGRDIEAGGYNINHTKAFTFAGVLDGKDHIVSNLQLTGRPLLPFVAGSEVSTAVVKNINFVDPVYNATGANQGMIIGNATGATLSNIHVYGGKVTSRESIAGLVGKASLYTNVSECSFDGEVLCTGDEAAAGIVGTLQTSSTISACAVTGKIKGGSVIGGIVSSITTNAGATSDCHVNAEIVGEYTIGGIAGESGRPLIQNCHVEGSMEATSSPRWGGGPMLGGIVGELAPKPTSSESETTEEPAESTAVVKGCFVNLTSFTFSGTLAEEEYKGQNRTMHRIVGKSSVNNSPEITGYDPQDNPIYGEPGATEDGLVDNYAVVTLNKIADDIEDNTTTTEGKSVATEDIKKDFFTSLGWQYGDEVAKPWALTGDQTHPALWFEGGLLMTQPLETIVLEGDAFTIEVVLAGSEITEDMLSGLTFDISDETIFCSTKTTLVDGKIFLDFDALKPGKATLTIGLNGKTATTLVTVQKKSTAIDNVTTQNVNITINERIATAEGCVLNVYSLLGSHLLTGTNNVNLSRLCAGIYIVTATAAGGSVASVKVSLR